jgi:ribosomal protein S18 acetylase RimI-like enzyme
LLVTLHAADENGEVALEIRATTDAAEAQQAGLSLLQAHPVDHNVILTLLDERIKNPEPGRYWYALDSSGPVGFVFQSPPTYRATLLPARREVLASLAAQIAEEAPDLPGIMGEATSAATFSGYWTEHRGAAATPLEGGRLYVLGSLLIPTGVPGGLRRARENERDLLVGWLECFYAEAAEAPTRAEPVIDRRLGEGRMWVWDNSGPVSMAMATNPMYGVSRIGLVYTPDALRGKGFASACVGALSAQMLTNGATACMLYTQLHNAISNSIYRRLGYEAHSEVLSYRFDNVRQLEDAARRPGNRQG